MLKERFFKVQPSIIENTCMFPVSDGAKVMYTYLNYLQSLSVSNGYVTNDGKAFVMCSYKKLMSVLKHARGTIAKFLKELEEACLIKRVRRGQGKCNLIFVYSPNTKSDFYDDGEKDKHAPSKEELAVLRNRFGGILDEEIEKIRRTGHWKCYTFKTLEKRCQQTIAKRESMKCKKVEHPVFA